MPTRLPDQKALLTTRAFSLRSPFSPGGLRFALPGGAAQDGVSAVNGAAQEANAEGRRRVRPWEPIVVFLLTVGVLSLALPRITTYLSPLTGDEPFYLMTAISILQDGDLNECNNYRQMDELQIYPAMYSPSALPRDFKGWRRAPIPLPPHPALINPWTRDCVSTNGEVSLPRDGTGNELYSKHGLGMSLLVLPAFAAGGLLMVAFFLTLLGSLLAANVYLFARESLGSALPAVLTWLAFAFTVPQMPYSFLIFPELPAALFVLYAFRRIRLWHNNPLQVAAIGLCIAFLPWLHYRFVPVCAGLFIYYIYQEWRQRSGARFRNGALVLGQIIVSAALLMLFFYHRYGYPFPNPEDHAGISDFGGTMRGAMGLFIDQQWGLFVAAPIFILALVGLILMGVERKWRHDLLWIGVVFVPYFALISNYAQWWGEWCPPARYMASVLPLLALPFSVSLNNIKGWAYRGIYGALLLLSLLVMWGFLYQPQWMYNQPSGRSEIITKGLPTLLNALPVDVPTAAITATLTSEIPTFVYPYFLYTHRSLDEETQKYWGDTYSAAAWADSVMPLIFIGVVVLASLALAWLPMRKRGYTGVPQERGPDELPGTSATAREEDVGEKNTALPLPLIDIPAKESRPT